MPSFVTPMSPYEFLHLYFLVKLQCLPPVVETLLLKIEQATLERTLRDNSGMLFGFLIDQFMSNGYCVIDRGPPLRFEYKANTSIVAEVEYNILVITFQLQCKDRRGFVYVAFLTDEMKFLCGENEISFWEFISRIQTEIQTATPFS